VTRRARIAAACERVVESSWFDPLMLSIIALNAVTLGLETYESIDASIGDELHLLNDVILGLFVIELALRMAALRRSPARVLPQRLERLRLRGHHCELRAGRP
jgi:voltage-gated sodium channel